jgi:Flp pilus assembly protein TadB
MSVLSPVLAGIAAFALVVGVLGLLWTPAIRFYRAFSDAIRYHDPFQSLVIGFGGGGIAPGTAESWRTGQTNEVHDQLNLTVEQYRRGLVGGAILIGVFFGAFSALLINVFGAVALGVVMALVAWVLLDLGIRDNLRRTHEEQLRRFPFFLDIFQLTVQSGGDLKDAIASYRTIYRNDPIGKELAILLESYPAFGVADSFDRLRNRVGNVDLKNVIGELAQKIRVGENLERTLALQSEDMRDLREELAAKKAEQLNTTFNIPVVCAPSRRS